MVKPQTPCASKLYNVISLLSLSQRQHDGHRKIAILYLALVPTSGPCCHVTHSQGIRKRVRISRALYLCCVATLRLGIKEWKRRGQQVWARAICQFCQWLVRIFHDLAKQMASKTSPRIGRLMEIVRGFCRKTTKTCWTKIICVLLR